MGASVSVETHLTAKDVYVYSLQSEFYRRKIALDAFGTGGLSVAEVEYFFRRYRSMRFLDASALNPNGIEENSPMGSNPPISKPMEKEQPESVARKNDAFISMDNSLGVPVFFDQLRMDWLLARVYYTLFPPGKPVSFATFLNAVVTWRQQTMEQRLEFFYKILDYDQDGLLTASDLSIFIQQLVRHKFKVGDRVRVRNDSRIGVLRYLGETKFADGIWAGLELDDNLGKHNGTVQGVKYFSCEQGHGVFVQFVFIELLEHHILALDILGQLTGTADNEEASLSEFVQALSADTLLSELVERVNIFGK